MHGLNAKQSPKHIYKLIILLAGFMLSHNAYAAFWSTTSVLLLSGSGYKDVPSNQEYSTQVLTFEHADGWEYGSNFFFVDVTDPNSSNSSFYSELSPSLSLSKMTGKDVSFGVIKDILLTGAWELSDATNAKLFGLGFHLNIPNIPVATVNLYQRIGESDFYKGQTSQAFQVTLIWSAPFNIESTQWVFEGYFDYATAENNVGKKENITSSPRLFLDLGNFWGVPNRLHAGVEWSYWMNKYGSDIDESVPQAAIKWTF